LCRLLEAQSGKVPHRLEKILAQNSHNSIDYLVFGDALRC